MFRIFFFCFFLSFFSSFGFAQDDSISYYAPSKPCNFVLLPDSFEITASVRASDQNNRIHTYDLRWVHFSESVDSFWIYSSTPNSPYLFFSTPNLRMLTSPLKAPHRAMAMHHLRERIFGTLLRYDDFELLAHMPFFCPDSMDVKQSRLRTTTSNTWFSVRWQPVKPLSQFSFSGMHGLQRSMRIDLWHVAKKDSTQFPAQLWMEESSGLFAEIKIHPMQFIRDSKSIVLPTWLE